MSNELATVGPTEGQREINRVVNKGLQLILSMAKNGRAHRESSGTVNDLKIGLCIDIASSFRSLHNLALKQQRMVKDQDVHSQAYLKIAHEALGGMVTAVKAMPDVDETPPLAPPPEPVEEQPADKPQKRFRAAEPTAQNLVGSNIKEVKITYADRRKPNGGRQVRPTVVDVSNGEPAVDNG